MREAICIGSNTVSSIPYNIYYICGIRYMVYMHYCPRHYVTTYMWLGLLQVGYATHVSQLFPSCVHNLKFVVRVYGRTHDSQHGQKRKHSQSQSSYAYIERDSQRQRETHRRHTHRSQHSSRESCSGVLLFS